MNCMKQKGTYTVMNKGGGENMDLPYKLAKQAISFVS